MRLSQRTSGFHLDDVGGAVIHIQPIARIQPIAPYALKPALKPDAAKDDDAYADLYPAVAPHPPAHRHRNTKNRLKALAIAEARLNQVCEELLALADEIRYLHPPMADALDDAWNGADTALGTLFDEDAW